MTAERLLGGRVRNPWKVGSLAFLTFGLYFFHWWEVTWSEIKEELKDDRMKPGWHTVALFVPIYQFYVVGEHYIAIDRLQRKAEIGVPSSFVLPVILALVAALCVGSAVRSDSPLGFEARLVAFLIGESCLAMMIMRGQASLNAYWRAVGR